MYAKEYITSYGHRNVRDGGFQLLYKVGSERNCKVAIYMPARRRSTDVLRGNSAKFEYILGVYLEILYLLEIIT